MYLITILALYIFWSIVEKRTIIVLSLQSSSKLYIKPWGLNMHMCLVTCTLYNINCLACFRKNNSNNHVMVHVQEECEVWPQRASENLHQNVKLAKPKGWCLQTYHWPQSNLKNAINGGCKDSKSRFMIAWCRGSLQLDGKAVSWVTFLFYLHV